MMQIVQEVVRAAYNYKIFKKKTGFRGKGKRVKIVIGQGTNATTV